MFSPLPSSYHKMTLVTGARPWARFVMYLRYFVSVVKLSVYKSYRDCIEKIFLGDNRCTYYRRELMLLY